MAVAENLPNLTKAELLVWCASQIGTTESPRGSNRVPYWLNTKPEWNGSSWCAAFLISGALRCGEDMRDDFGWGPYYVPQIAADAKAAGQWFTTPQSGDWCVMGNKSYSHVGIVEKVIRSGKAGTTDLIVQTIEGNTSPTDAGSQNNGDGVYRKRRTGSYVKGFFRPKYAAPVVAPKPPAKTTWTRTDIKNMQKLLEVSQDGNWGPNTRTRAQAFRAVAAESIPHNDAQIRITQEIIDVKVDGSFGPASRAALPSRVKELQSILKVKPDGNWGPATDAAYVKFYNEWSGK